MIGPIAAATLAAAVAGSGAPVAPCMWDAVAVDRATLLAEGMEAVPEPALRAAAAACGQTGDNIDNAEFPFGFYVGSRVLAQRLSGKWSPETLAAVIDAIPDDQIQFFWMSDKSRRTDAYRRQEAAAWSTVYQALGEPPTKAGDPLRDSDLERYIVSRVGWRIGEKELIEHAKERASRP